MKLEKAIEERKEELSDKYRDVVYIGYEIVDMTKNTTTSSYIKEKIDIDSVNVELIKDRFKEIDGEIKAVKVVFDVKYPRKKKYSKHEEYYRIV